MKWVRVTVGEKCSYGYLEGKKVNLIQGTPFGDGWKETGEVVELANVKLLAPVEPSKVVAIGLNYAEHAEEVGFAQQAEPVIFLKAPTTLVGPDEPVQHPRQTNRLEHEAELAIVIKEKCKEVSIEKVKDYILGYTCFNDITARDIQKSESQWARGKSFDTTGPIGPMIVTDIDPLDLEIICRVNGETKQQARTSLMIHDVYKLVSYVSENMTLLPGDVIITGSPKGVSVIKPGDQVEVEIEGIGILSNPVIA